MLSRLPRNVDHPFDLQPGADALKTLAKALDLQGLRKLRFTGQLTPEGKRNWRLEAQLGATVVQPCVITAEPVTTRIEEKIVRRYLAGFAAPDADEAEMPEDDTIEPLPETLDLPDVMAEALSLALPAFPRAEGAELGSAVFAAPGVKPMTDEDAKPLAGLAALRDRMTGDEPPEDAG